MTMWRPSLPWPLLHYSSPAPLLDYGQARYWFKKAAEESELDAQLHLGRLYEEGLGVARDYDRARDYYKLAAAIGSASALNALAVLYKEGRGVAKDYARAAELFGQAGQGGDGDGYFNLALFHVETKDYAKARHYYEQALAYHIYERAANQRQDTEVATMAGLNLRRIEGRHDRF